MFCIISLGLTAQVPSYVPTNGLVGWWPFNGNANDESGNGNNGTVNGATLTTDRFGVANKAYSFNPSSNSNVTIPFSNSLNSIQNGITLSAWIYMDGGTPAGTPPRILELRGAYGGGGDAGFVMLSTTNNATLRAFELRWYNNNGNSNLNFSPTNSTLTTLNWHLVTFTADGTSGTAKYYFDGVLQSTSTNSIITQCNYNNNSLILGAEPNLLGKWGGKLDDIAIYNRALTQQEITNLYTSTVTLSCLPSYVPTNGLVGYWPFCGNANDESGNVNNGTVNGATLTTDRFGLANKAYSFDGVNDFIQTGVISELNSSTNSISIWLKASDYSDHHQIEYAGTSFGTLGRAFAFNLARLANVPTTNCIDANIPGLKNLNGELTQNSWCHLVFISEGTIGKFYLNGSYLGQTAIGSPICQNALTLVLGRGTNGSGPRWYNGHLDDIAIYNRVLTQQEITNLYSGSTPPTITTSAAPTLINCGESTTLTASSTSAAQPCLKADLPATLQNGLVGYWPFCGNANDASGNNNNGTVNGATLTTDRFGNTNSSLQLTNGVQIMCTNNLANNPNQFSISLWFNSSNTSIISAEGLGRIFGFDNGQCQHIFNQDRYIDLMANGQVRFHINHLTGNYFSYSNPGKNDGLWHYVVCTFGVDGMKIYVDNVLEGSNTNNLISSYNGYWRVGGLNDLNSPSFIGSVDDISLYNKVLIPSEIQQLFTLGNINYSWSPGSATSPTITVSPTQTTTYTCTASNSAGSSTSSITVNVADTLTWTGTVDTNWHKPCNWNPQFVPKCCNNVLVPFTSNQPVVSGIAAAEDVTINSTSGAVIRVNSGANLQVGVCPITITQTACPSLAVITTTAVSSITQATAISGGTISYQGASAITARGICWSTSANPTLANSFTTNGTGVGTFTANLTGLTAGTTYYVRAFATNASGTSYGNEVSFATSSPVSIGQMYQGGTVVYLFQAGDPGYEALNQHGIIVYPSLLGPSEWGCYGTQLNVFNTVLGSGNNNTNSIFAACSNASYAAKICCNLNANGYSDWYLPSKDELNKIYLQRLNLSFLNNSVGYWSSSETAINTAYGQLFGQTQSSSSVSVSKTTPYYFVAIRNF
jgi:hypothetical protein